ncbi:MAG: flagellar basal body P-ring formation chaperone FlgA [Pseudomonadota bacterium]
MNDRTSRPPVAPRTLLAAAALAGCLLPAQATDVPPAALPPAVLAAAAELAREAALPSAPRAARVLAVPGTPDPRLRLAPCERIEPHLLAGQPVWGRTRIGLRGAGGPVAWRVTLRVEVRVLAPALAARGPTPAGTARSADLFRLAEIDWAASPQAPLASLEGVAGRTLARAIGAGQPLQSAHLQRRQWFAGGDVVRIVAVGPGYSVATDGVALGSGIEGQLVRVRTESGRIVIGRPVAAQRVEVTL